MLSPTTFQMTNRPSTSSTFTKYTINNTFLLFYCNYAYNNTNASKINNNNSNNYISNKLSKIIKSLWWLFLQYHRNFLNILQKHLQQHIDNYPITTKTQQENHHHGNRNTIIVVSLNLLLSPSLHLNCISNDSNKICKTS